MDSETQTTSSSPSSPPREHGGLGSVCPPSTASSSKAAATSTFSANRKAVPTFKIYLPCAKEASEATTVAKPRHTFQPQAVGTVLLVEDEANLRRLSLESLQRQGYTVLEAQDGPAALQIATHNKSVIHLLLTDVVMPG